jgi:hypothetical protein
MAQLTIIDRIKLLEEKQTGLDQSLDLTLEQVKDTSSTTLTVVDAVVSVLQDLNLAEDFAMLVQKKIQQKRQERIDGQLAQEKTQRDAMVNSGVIKVTDTVTENSVLVVNVKTPEGQTIGLPLRAVEFSQFKADSGPRLLGQKVGFILESDSKETVEIVEIFDIVQSQPIQQEEVVITTPEAPAAPTEG